MKYQITVQVEGRKETYIGIGSRDALMDAAYDNGAMSVSIKVCK